MKSQIKLRRGLKNTWESINPVLSAGEAGVEIDTGQMKIGDGIRQYTSLPYTGSGAISLQAHVDSLTPHPVYDDGPALDLLYENAKV